MTSSSNFNHADQPNLSYTSVIDGNCINLTPLGKFVMPPPMFEKQVQVEGTSHPVSCMYMHGHQVFGVSGDSLVTFDAEKY
jgi:IKI3 family